MVVADGGMEGHEVREAKRTSSLKPSGLGQGLQTMTGVKWKPVQSCEQGKDLI